MTQVLVSINPDIPEPDLSQLRLFHDRVVALAGTRLVKGGQSNINASLRLEAGKDLARQVVLPPEEQVAQFLMAFRFFYMKSEMTHFPRIVNLVSRYAAPPAPEVFRSIKARWEHSCSVQLRINGKPISSGKLIDLWFNAHYFHGEQAKREQLDGMNALLSHDLSKFMLLDAVYNASEIVRGFHAGIGALFVPIGTEI
ncbi:hypothetical protein [Pseudoxanthomonas sp. z9]|uniref:hypothetical protein n=1 Tax=Pseudoxanthomonas sp. z9 TaxID=2584942 RepID=UPI0011412AA9|nr:hypothetical protein [Pseudoxanthomonas sp. z9]